MNVDTLSNLSNEELTKHRDSLEQEVFQNHGFSSAIKVLL
jgi:hypothetical protein